MRVVGQFNRGRANLSRSAVFFAALLGLSGCVTRTTVLVNDQGKTETCKISGRIGFVSEYILHERMRHCIDKARSRGFHQAPPGRAGNKLAPGERGSRL